MNQATDAVAHNLKTLRESRNLSLDQLSGKTGVSKSMLRQIENGKSSPTIATISKIANGLKVSFTTLLKQPVVEAEVKSYTGVPSLVERDGHYRVYPLILFDPERPVETYYIELDPDTTFHGQPHEGNVYEYIFVRSGTIRVTVQGRDLVAGENEFIQFFADGPHEYANDGDKTVTAIMQLSYLP